MSGGGQIDPNAGAAMANGSAGTAGNAAQIAALPQWQRGLLGAVTGDPKYGKNAPNVSALLQHGIGLMSSQQQQPQMPPRQQPGPMPPSPGMMGPQQQPPNPMMAGLPNPWQRGQ